MKTEFNEDRNAEENPNAHDAGNKLHRTDNPSGKPTRTADHMESSESGSEGDDVQENSTHTEGVTKEEQYKNSYWKETQGNTTKAKKG